MILRLTVGALAWLASPSSSVSARSAGGDDPGSPAAASRVEIVTVFDNYAAVPNVATRWGFAAVVRADDETVLFDTGSDGSVLLANMARLDIDPTDIDHVVISHAHCDHAGGLTRLLAIHPDVEVHLPFEPKDVLCGEPFPEGAKIHIVEDAVQIAPGVHATGPLGGRVPEQALVVSSASGIVVVTGCAHPGIVRTVRRASALFPDRPIELVMGGFHLLSASESKLTAIIRAFAHLGVRRVSPTHCTGERARERLRTEYGERFHSGGVGARFTFGSGRARTPAASPTDAPLGSRPW